MSEQSTQERLAAIEARLAITEILNAYALYIDRRRWDDFEGLFADTVELSLIRTDQQWVTMTKSELAHRARGGFETYDATQHISANHVITLAGSAATAWSTLNATHHVKSAEGGQFQQQVGYYEHHFAYDEKWRITKLRQIVHWQRGNQQIFDSTVGTGGWGS